MSRQALGCSTDVAPESSSDAPPVLEIDGLRKRFFRRSLADRIARRPATGVVALDDVSVSVMPGEALAIVGESGSGKTTLAHSLVRLVEPEAGRVLFGGQDVLTASRKDLSAVRRQIQLIYQDPYTSLNPAIPIGKAIIEPALVHGLIDKQTAPERLQELMSQVGLSSGLAQRRPRALSGGQRQRVAIARALAAKPEILIADEAVSALDVSVQAQVIRLFARLRDELGLTLIFVSHQLATVAQLCERVAIMHRGRLVEIGPTHEVFNAPRHGYTATLIQAHPGGRRLRQRTHIARDSKTAPTSEQPGCLFRHRCPYAIETCTSQTPPPIPIAPHHTAHCHVLPYDPARAAAAGIHRSADLLHAET